MYEAIADSSRLYAKATFVVDLAGYEIIGRGARGRKDVAARLAIGGQRSVG